MTLWEYITSGGPLAFLGEILGGFFGFFVSPMMVLIYTVFGFVLCAVLALFNDFIGSRREVAVKFTATVAGLLFSVLAFATLLGYYIQECLSPTVWESTC